MERKISAMPVYFEIPIASPSSVGPSLGGMVKKLLGPRRAIWILIPMRDLGSLAEALDSQNTRTGPFFTLARSKRAQ